MCPIQQCSLTLYEFVVVGLQRCSLLGHDANFEAQARAHRPSHVLKVR